MGIRDDELKRLEAYAKSLGIRVTYRKSKKEHSNAAEFYIDGSGIIVYTWPALSKTRTVLNLLHEVAHAVHWVHTKRTIDKELMKALVKEANRCKGEVLDESDRKLIYEDEHVATNYWNQIVKLVDIRINPMVILLRKKLDIFTYRYYYETGEFPTNAVINQKKKEFIHEERTKSKQARRNGNKRN